MPMLVPNLNYEHWRTMYQRNSSHAPCNTIGYLPPLPHLPVLLHNNYCGLAGGCYCVTWVLRRVHGDGLPERACSRGARSVPPRCSAERGARGGEVGELRRWRQCVVSSSCRVRKGLACVCLPHGMGWYHHPCSTK